MADHQARPMTRAEVIAYMGHVPVNPKCQFRLCEETGVVFRMPDTGGAIYCAQHALVAAAINARTIEIRAERKARRWQT